MGDSVRMSFIYSVWLVNSSLEVLIMEDLAYIYLVLNDEIERSQNLDEDHVPTPSSTWAPPIPMEADCDRATQLFSEQPDDSDFTFHPYQGFFYL